jgi:hypothetical protein
MPRFWSIGENDGKWKIKHYVLSMTIPNKTGAPLLKLKSQ